MHEMALCQSVISIIEEAARCRAFSRVASITLEIGVFGHVDPEAMLFCFDAISRGTISEGARLIVERVPGAGWCPDCRKTVVLTERFAPCAICGQHNVQMTSGDELRVRDMEVE